MKESLLSVIFKNSKRKDNTGNNDKRQNVLNFVAFLIVFGSLAISMIIISYGLTKKLMTINQEYMFINILLLMDFGILFVKSIFESLNVLYFSKDLKLILRLPLKPSTIINAKMLKMIESEYQMEIIMLAIPMVVFGILNKVGFLFYLYTLLILIIIPIIPIAIASIVMAIIMRFTNIIKDKNKVMYISIIVGFIILDLIIGIASTNISMENAAENLRGQVLELNGVANALANSFVLIKTIMNSIQNYNNVSGFLNIGLYTIVSLAFYAISILIISPIYLKGAVGTTLNGERAKAATNSELSIADFKETGRKKSYILKEYKMMSRSPIFFIQCIFLPIIYPLAIFVTVIGFVGLASLLGVNLAEKLNAQINSGIGQAIFISVAQIFFMMNFASIIAVSKDGIGAIRSKVLPISFERQFKFKTWIGRTANIFSGLLVISVYYLLTKSFLQTLIVLAILISQNRLGENLKLLVDLKNPQITWESEYTMMKQNSNVMYILFYSLVFVGLFFLLGKIIGNAIIYINVIMWISIIANLYIDDFIRKRQNRLFEKVF